MAYSDRNFKTKKALKEAVAAWNAYAAKPEWEQVAPTVGMLIGIPKPEAVTIHNPGIGTAPTDGIAFLEGPHYPASHTWYAQVTMQDGKVVKVK